MVTTVLHRLPSLECPNQKGCLSPASYAGNHGEHGGHPTRFSCMDLKSGFWQVKTDKESRQYTTFTMGSMGVYEFLHMPYGLCNTPATFQCLMQNCLVELNLTYALIYLDHMIIYSKTEDKHLVCLRAILERFMENSLKLIPSKCNFFHTEINYLGHKVSMA